jgi:cobalt-zinc-cadmium efflux system outer membrane protein
VAPFKRFYCCALAATLACNALYSGAAELSLQQALQLALERNPTLQAEGFAVRAAEAELKSSQLSLPWSLGTELENFAGNDSLSGIRGAEATIRLSRTFERAGKREARIAPARIGVSQQQQMAERAQLELASAVRQRYQDVVERQTRLGILQSTRERLQTTRMRVAQWVEVGRSPTSELSLAEIAVIRATLAIDEADRSLTSGKIALSSLWGEVGTDFSTSPAELMNLPALPNLDALVARLPQSFEQQRLALATEQLTAQRRAEMASAKPDVTLSIGARRLEGSNQQALVFSASLPLGAPRRSVLSVERVDAQLAELTARRSAAQLDARQQVLELYQHLAQARLAFETHRDALIGTAESAVQVTRRSYELGRLNFLALAQTEQLLVDLRLAQLDAAARYHRALLDIERLTATSGVPAP